MKVEKRYVERPSLIVVKAERERERAESFAYCVPLAGK